MSPYHLAIALALVSPLAACDPLDILSGKSSYRAEQERRAALTLPKPLASSPAAEVAQAEVQSQEPVQDVPECTSRRVSCLAVFGW